MINGMQLCSNLWLVFFAVWILAAIGTKRAARRVDWARQISYAVPVVSGFTLLLSSRVEIAVLNRRILPRTEALAIIGIVMTAVGMAFAAWARIHLGRNWSSAPMVKDQHQLIRSGPYRLVRHPIYSGLLLAAAGTMLANGKVRGLAGLGLIWLGFVIKSRIEEEFMIQTFGQQYDEYRRTTGALFPRIGA